VEKATEESTVIVCDSLLGPFRNGVNRKETTGRKMEVLRPRTTVRYQRETAERKTAEDLACYSTCH